MHKYRNKEEKDVIILQHKTLMVLHGKTGSCVASITKTECATYIAIQNAPAGTLRGYAVTQQGLQPFRTDENGAVTLTGVQEISALFLLQHGAILLEGNRHLTKQKLEEQKREIRMLEAAAMKNAAEEQAHREALLAHPKQNEKPDNKLITATASAEIKREKQPGNSEALHKILESAKTLFPQPEASVPSPGTTPIANPFPAVFPVAKWQKRSYVGTDRYTLEGSWQTSRGNFRISAIPGNYAPTTPMRQRGYTKFLRATDGNGYWISIKNRQN